MELATVQHYGDKRDCYALEKKKFLIRLRTKKGDMKQVTLLSQDKYLDREVKDTRTSRPMELVASDQEIMWQRKVSLFRNFGISLVL